MDAHPARVQPGCVLGAHLSRAQTLVHRLEQAREHCHHERAHGNGDAREQRERTEALPGHARCSP